MSKLDISKLNLHKYQCPICDSENHKNLYFIQGFHIVQCKSCRMTFVNPRICNEQIFDVYRDEYFHRNQDGYNGYESIADLRIQTFKKWYKDIEPHCTAKIHKRVALDIGCAAGYFLDILKENHWQIEAIELDCQMYASLIQNGYDVSNDPLEYFTSSHQYDLIAMFDVIEHLPELQKDFAKISSLLSPNGILAISTPNIDSFQHRLFRRRWFQFKPVEHLHYFSPLTIKRLAQEHGLSVEVMKKSGQYANMTFIIDRLNHYGFGVLASLFSFFAKLFAIERLTWYADSGSMFVILRKNQTGIDCPTEASSL
jgi:2-polyprenyl-3-methyl-5-hydroxy-6-metoxy-1,4-benzoquinol methylase